MRAPQKTTQLSDEQKVAQAERMAAILQSEKVQQMAKDVNHAKIESDKIAQRLIAEGGKAWHTDKHARVYVDVTAIPNIVDLSSLSLSKTKLYDMSTTKVYWDVLGQEFYWDAIWQSDFIAKSFKAFEAE